MGFKIYWQICSRNVVSKPVQSWKAESVAVLHVVLNSDVQKSYWWEQETMQMIVTSAVIVGSSFIYPSLTERLRQHRAVQLSVAVISYSYACLLALLLLLSFLLWKILFLFFFFLFAVWTSCFKLRNDNLHQALHTHTSLVTLTHPEGHVIVSRWRCYFSSLNGSQASTCICFLWLLFCF